MELRIAGWDITFKVLEERVLAYVNARIQNGEFSERALAAVLGISQPQLHNVLKGARALQTPLADAFLAQFGITVIDLLTASELAEREKSGEFALADELIRLRLLRKKSALTRVRDRSDWETG